MADDLAPPSIDPVSLEEACAKGVDVEILIDRTLRQELPAKRDPAAARAAAAAIVEDYNARYDRDGPWIEAWRNWE